MIHATLTEDEEVLREALAPGPADLCLALFARGNGDAALALLAAGAGSVRVEDRFDHPALMAQLGLKKALVGALTGADTRGFIGLDPGMSPARRQEILDSLDLPGDLREYWGPRRSLLLAGMVEHDQTRAFGRSLARAVPVVDRLRRWPWLLDGLLRLALLGSPLFFPEPERRNSLGYRQLREDPLPVLDRLLERAGRSPGGDFVGAGRMDYLSAGGLDRIRDRLHRIQERAPGQGEGPYTRIYLSNLPDYLPGEEFHRLLSGLLDITVPGSRVFFNSTRAGPDIHPSLQPLVEARRVRFLEEATLRLRAKDRQGVYPGLSVVQTIT